MELKRLFVSVIIALTLLTTFSTVATAAILGSWVPSVTAIRGTSAGGGEALPANEALITVLPNQIKYDGLGMINVLVEIPDDYTGTGWEVLAGSKFSLIIEESKVEDIRPGDTSFTVVFSLSDGTDEIEFWGADDVLVIE